MYDNVIGHKTAIAFLATVVALLSQSLSTAVGSGNFFLDPAELYIKKQISAASGTVKLLDANTKELPGICSFNSDGKMDQNRAAIWNRISIKYGTGNDGASAGGIDYTDAIPPELANADLIITQKGRPILKRSVRSCYARGVETEAGSDYINLASLRLFVDDEDVSIDLEFPTGVATSAAGAGTTPFIYVSIDALTTRKA